MGPLKISVDLGENYGDPSTFVNCVELADKYDFDAAWFGDHLYPFIHSTNRIASPYVWSVFPVALERTRRIKTGPDVTCPIGGRFHPFIIAQSAATIDCMYPGRLLLAVGSGEAINESRFFPTGYPKWRERIERLVEAVVLMKKLWKSQDYFSFDGKYFKMENAYLYTKPKTELSIYFSAMGVKSASYAGTYGDSLVTQGSVERCKEIISVFESSALKAGKDPSRMEKMVLFDPVYADKTKGLEELRKTGEAAYLVDGAFNEADPRKIEQMSSRVTDEDLLRLKYFCPSPKELIEVLDRYRKVGVTHIAISTQIFQDKIRMIGEKVLPYFLSDGA
ncbi:MAG: LLM class flavin-dependent oxidoreductase [Candidatus Bathyarchaeia archaeon]